MDLLKSVGAAGSSAVITVTGIHPIDVVKTRLQVSGITIIIIITIIYINI